MEHEKIAERENEISIDGGDKESNPELQSPPPQLQSPDPPAATTKYCHQVKSSVISSALYRVWFRVSVLLSFDL